MLTLSQIVAAFEAHLDSQFHGPAILKVERLEDQNGMAVAVFTYHGGKPEHVFTSEYKFQWDETEDRVIVYFW